MKKQILRLLALLMFASVIATTVTSCSVEYRQRHGHHDDHGHDHDHDNDHHYRNY
jgi:ABC-type nickel/cobalt efflux system permease component RcnA